MGFTVGASVCGEARWSWSLVCCCHDYYCLELVVLFLEMLLVRYGWVGLSYYYYCYQYWGSLVALLLERYLLVRYGWVGLSSIVAVINVMVLVMFLLVR